MSNFELTREEQEAMSGGEVKTTKMLWETGKGSSSTSSGHGNHATGTGSGDKENIIEKEVLMAKERERQLRREREERAKQLQVQGEALANATNNHHQDTHQVSHHQHHDDTVPTASKDTHASSASSHSHGAAAATASHHTDPHTATVKVAETNNNQQHNHEHAEQHHHHNTSHDEKHNHHVTDAADREDSMPKPAPTVSMTYEEIIAEVKDKGAGRVFDEIQQQKAREDELRRNYGDRGIHVTSYQSSSVISVSRPSPAANHSEPVTQHLHDNDHHPSAVTHSNGVDEAALAATAHNDDHHISARKVSTTEAAASSANSSSPSPAANSKRASSPPSVEGTKDAETGPGRRVSSVHRNSWLTADLTDSAYRYMPHVETPIEREIRLNQERESELRSKTAANTLSRGESVEQKTGVPIAASSIRRQRQDKTDVNVKEKRRTFEVETISESNYSNNDNNVGGVTSPKWDKRRASEIVIEKELREMRAREEELRLTRISK